MSPRDDIFVIYDFDAKVTSSDVYSEFSEETFGPRHVEWHSDQLLYLRILSDNKKRIMEELCSRSPISGGEHLFNYSVARYCDYGIEGMKMDDDAADGVGCVSDVGGLSKRANGTSEASPIRKKRRLGDTSTNYRDYA